MTHKLIRAPEAFRRLGISSGAGYKAIHDGTLPVEPIRIGGQYKFRAADVDRILDGPGVTADTLGVTGPGAGDEGHVSPTV